MEQIICEKTGDEKQERHRNEFAYIVHFLQYIMQHQAGSMERNKNNKRKQYQQ